MSPRRLAALLGCCLGFMPAALLAGDHWAFRPPIRPNPPATRTPGFVRRPLDAFVLARLEREGLAPARPAQPETWLRRAGFDLVGLAPTAGELDAFRADREARGEAAFEAAVDRLLSSARFGERQAQEWLDLARYADTHGFNNDSSRTQWRWRDWVIGAFNADLPYDRFITEQLAGDLLPGPEQSGTRGIESRVATGFCRNHVVNSEGGIIGEEYRVEYVADRVRTLGMAWLGLSLECARCHDHKFDPLSQRDYYRLFAFFNGVDEFGEDGRIGNAAPIVQAPTIEQQADLARLDRDIASAGRAMAETPLPPVERVRRWLAERTAIEPVAPPSGARFDLAATPLPEARPRADFGPEIALGGTNELTLDIPPAAFSPAQPWTLAAWVRWEGGEAPLISTMDHLLDPSAGGSGRGAEVRITRTGRIEIRLAEFWPSYAVVLLSDVRLAAREWRHVAVSYDASGKASGVALLVDGRAESLELRRDGLPGKNASSHRPRLGRTIARAPELAQGALAGLRLYTNVLALGSLSPWIEDQALRARVQAGENAEALDGIARHVALRDLNTNFARLESDHRRWTESRLALLRGSPQAMVMAEADSPRPTYLLARGLYDARRDPVEPGVPESLLGPWPKGAPENRLGLARWLTQPNHPLTARVVVNRVWAQCFGTGLVKTVEDFGTQGEAPSHPELLDWLAREFVDGGWSYKRLLREIVLSATYRQDSTVTPALRERDPANRLLGRGPRLRLSSESIRDHALASAGLLRHRLGGPSVFPPQPESLYAGIVVAADYPGTKWVPSEGDDRYRRSLYTFWKRTVPHPVMTTFDAPDRESCTARRLPTNTPLQALALLNEPAFVEAGHALGLRALREGGPDDRHRAGWLFRVMTARSPGPGESESLLRTLARFRGDFERPGRDARKILGREGSVEEAAWAELGSLALNLDEAITKN